jgi:hypothetical protein
MLKTNNIERELGKSLYNAHFNAHKNLPMAPVMNQTRRAQTTLSYFSNNHFNIIYPSMLKSL